MKGHVATRTRIWSFRCFLAGLILAISAATAVAQSSPTIVKVEEDWELLVATPDPDSDSPQVTCVISPTGNVNSLHAAFDLNHQSQPSYVAGGLQLQIWCGEAPLYDRKYPNEAVIAEPAQTIRWTQGVRVIDGGLVFEITGGSSSTWGAFGGQGYLKAAMVSALSSLNGYDPAVSVAHSGIGYAANRVQSLVLRRVRLTTSTGQVLEDDTPRIVHSLD